MKTLDELRDIVSRCAFPTLEITVNRDSDHTAYLQVGDPNGRCNVTGELRPWTGRKWRMSAHMTETEVVKTALKAVLSAVEHETLEKFTYRGVTIFDPHIRVCDLLLTRQASPLDGRE